MFFHIVKNVFNTLYLTKKILSKSNSGENKKLNLKVNTGNRKNENKKISFGKAINFFLRKENYSERGLYFFIFH